MLFIVVVNFDHDFYVKQADDGSAIQGWKSEADACHYFTAAYDQRHRRGHEPSMSACLHWLMFQPAVVKIKHVNDIRRWLPTSKTPTSYELSTVAGGMRGLLLDRVRGRRVWQRGTRPALITTKKEVG